MTFISDGQPRELLVCFFAGCLSGFIYTPLNLIKNAVKPRGVKIALDIAALSLAGAVLCATSVIFKLGDFRAFMGVFCVCGLLCYAKSLHKAVAFAYMLLYNKLVKLFLKIKNAATSLFIKVKKNVGRKKTKSIRGDAERRNNADSDIRGDNSLSDVRYIRAEGKDRKARRGNSRARKRNRKYRLADGSLQTSD